MTRKDVRQRRGPNKSVYTTTDGISSVNGNENLKRPNGSASTDRDVEQSGGASNWYDLSNVTALIDWSLILLLIFGGCCSNVFTLEAIVKTAPGSGIVITFAQFLFTAVVTACNRRKISKTFPYIIERPVVPIWKWMINAILFLTVNLLNNYAFFFDISVPVHIILRSGGSITTMLVGFAWGKRFSNGQIAGVLLLTLGVVCAAFADAGAKGKTSSSSNSDTSSFTFGLCILFIAQVLSAFLGLYTQSIYAEHGPQWEENMLYSHAMSLLGAFCFLPQLRSQFATLHESEPILVDLSVHFYTQKVWSSISMGLGAGTLSGKDAVEGYHRKFDTGCPTSLAYLILNAFTQYLCIRGVNRLGAKTTALGVTIALNVRKLVSLFLSIIVFGNKLTLGVWFGAGLVFLGGLVYSAGDALIKRAAPRV